MLAEITYKYGLSVIRFKQGTSYFSICLKGNWIFSYKEGNISL